jgi:hypothetical protein
MATAACCCCTQHPAQSRRLDPPQLPQPHGARPEPADGKQHGYDGALKLQQQAHTEFGPMYTMQEVRVQLTHGLLDGPSWLIQMFCTMLCHNKHILHLHECDPAVRKPGIACDQRR